ncbi:MAG: hypothetical protein LUC93_04350 [Planctomycetaceae bacterium]|nr:hypothetical protein [Planctomycetaceae bacterium]
MNYLFTMNAETKSRYWVNNPTFAEVKQALENGVHSCTTNPAHCSKILQTDPSYMKGKVREVLASGVSLDDAPEAIYHQACGDIMALFRDHYDKTGGKEGFVTVQEDPSREEDHEYILAASRRAKKLGPNYMAKIPVTESGLKVIAAMVEENVPICATEVFTLSQAFAAYDCYKKASEKSGNSPVMYITHITGIMDDYFTDLVKKEKIAISDKALAMAGTAVGLKQYKLFKERGVPCPMLGGGVRRTSHFTNFVGGDMHVTINWPTAVELIEKNPPVENAIDQAVPQDIIDELLEKLPNFRRAWEEDGLPISEFAQYGPVMLFRTQFMNGWSRLYDEVRLLAK